MRRTTLAKGATCVSAVLLLTACSSGGGDQASPDDSGEAWSIPSDDPTATIQVLSILTLEKEGMNAVLAAFNEAHPTITVEYENVPFNDLNAVLDARMANKDGNPDVYWADQPRVAALAARGFATDITEQFADLTDAWDPAPLESSSYDGRLYGTPIANSTQLLYYNKDLLDAAGVTYPSADPENRATWEALIPEVEKVVAAGAQNGIVFGQVDRYYQLEPLPLSLGGSAGGTGEGNLTPDITSDAWVEALEFYGSIFEAGLSNRGATAEESDAGFLAGNTAYEIQGPWLLPTLAESDINWGVAAHPMFADGVAVTPTGSWSLALSPFADEKEAAAIFMKWMSVDDGGGYTLNRPDPELPASPEAKTAYFARDLFSSDEAAKAADIMRYETSTTAVPRLSTVGFVEFEEIIGRAFADVRNGADARAALESATAELETAWAPYK